jgi:hypothetical protein
VYAGPLEVPCCGVTALVCANRPECPGQLKVVDCSGCCRNFQVRPQGRIQPKPSELPKPAAGAETPTVARPPQPPDGKVCYIPLTQGKCAMIEAADYERVSQHKWHVTRHGDKFYACRKQNGKKCFMHRFLMDTPEGMVVDHINGNSLNTRCCIPRIVFSTPLFTMAYALNKNGHVSKYNLDYNQPAMYDPVALHRCSLIVVEGISHDRTRSQEKDPC